MTRTATEELDAPRPTVLQGRVWVLRDAEGRIIDDIDTDMIFHNAHLAVKELDQMGQYALGNLAGYEDFPGRVQPGDLILAGRNFGAGSSRQQAVDCFVALGCSALLAESFGAIYKRNAINAGFPIMAAGGLTELASSDGGPLVRTGDELRVDLRTGMVTHLPSSQQHQAGAMSGVQLDIYQAGDLFAFGASR
jgi:3-isopropylmalate/(R)-2-methylmalate dehydratase small subunit